MGNNESSDGQRSSFQNYSRELRKENSPSSITRSVCECALKVLRGSVASRVRSTKKS